MKKYKLGIIGSGSLGSIIGKYISKELYEDYEIVGILSGKIENAENLSNQINCKAYDSLDEIIKDKPDYIIEAASPSVVKDSTFKILENGINLIVLSVGAFADEGFYAKAAQLAKANNCRVHLASGAVGGFDVLSAAVLMEDVTVGITTEKSPSSLNGAPFLEGRELSQDISEEVFTGTAKEAIEVFPKNINVAVATALATIGVNRTNVIIRSIPEIKSNKHTISLKGETVKVTVEIESIPSPDNPKSSSIAAWSVISLLERLVAPITF